MMKDMSEGQKKLSRQTNKQFIPYTLAALLNPTEDKVTEDIIYFVNEQRAQ